LIVHEEQLYTVDANTAVPAVRVSLAEAGFREREHLQEWVIANPELLGDDVRIITFEFDRWVTASGAATWERLDVLALDRSGRLVLAELKRDRAPDAVMVQALNYAAMVSRFTLDHLADVYAARADGVSTSEEALAELREWAPTLSDETLTQPRIVLIAEDFGPVLTNTAMYLIEQGLDLGLVRVQLYRIGETMALTAAQVLPVPDAEEFMVRPRSGVATQRTVKTAATRRASIPERLVASGALSDGTELRIVVPKGTREDDEAITNWLSGDPQRPIAYWRQDAKHPVRLATDHDPTYLTTAIKRVIEAATGEPARTEVWGPAWFQTSDGTALHKLAEEVDPPAAGGFDWTALHRLLAALPEGRWTTYGSLAEIVGTSAQPLGNHLASCADCVNAHRVLGTGGRSSPNFRRTDPSDTRTQAEVLEAEGVSFNSGSADPSQRLEAADLRTLKT
jgi:alkylated DNA nucleotide flippase Atl1